VKPKKWGTSAGVRDGGRGHEGRTGLKSSSKKMLDTDLGSHARQGKKAIEKGMSQKELV